MKFLYTIIVSFFLISSALFSKSKLGEYYYGFGYSMAEGGGTPAIEGNSFNFSLNSPASDIADFKVYLDYGTAEQGATDNTVWNLGLDYLYHLDDFIDGGGMLRPFIGFGVGYLSDKAKMRLSEDGVTWTLIGGTEVMFTEELSLSVGARFLGVWADFGSNDLALDLGLSWWINDIHGVAFEYSHAFDNEIDYIGLKYLYSWQ